jgi:hypothetical protein
MMMVIRKPLRHQSTHKQTIGQGGLPVSSPPNRTIQSSSHLMMLSGYSNDTRTALQKSIMVELSKKLKIAGVSYEGIIPKINLLD